MTFHRCRDIIILLCYIRAYASQNISLMNYIQFILKEGENKGRPQTRMVEKCYQHVDLSLICLASHDSCRLISEKRIFHLRNNIYYYSVSVVKAWWEVGRQKTRSDMFRISRVSNKKKHDMSTATTSALLVSRSVSPRLCCLHLNLLLSPLMIFCFFAGICPGQ